ncbi:peroxidase-like [Ostrinia nubilalis]|uniref:peroxidase-like n=1 Tax=Ostrinia nubilalis TaxID=29057 RepID=UPI00308235E1
MNDKCIPITVPETDAFYRYYGVKCLNFVRSITTPRDDCSLGYAEQMNTVTSFLDGSNIYGSDKKLASKLRSKRGGRLKEGYKDYNKRGFLPTADDKTAMCDLRNISEPCYLAGDGRINQTPTLAMLHTLFLREHNRVTDILKTLNPLWTDEKLYQEARRIVIAEIQHITYQEWLPSNFGETYLRYYHITPSTLYSHDYNEEVNPGIINGFTAGAFRFLHSTIPDTIMTCPSNYYAAYAHRISDHYQNPSLLESSTESFDDLVRGILTQSAADSDTFCSSQISNLLFKSRNLWGLDLVAMDIQRGRDHGIASYNDYRELCGLWRARTFQDLSGEISQDRIYALSQMYECVDDVDLFVGGAMERPVQGSILGHTFQCIVGEQFYRTRVGDRYFYDNSEMPHSFSPDQLQELKKASIARIICDNTNVPYVQRRAFELETSGNPKVGCEDIQRVDLTAWKTSLFD